MTEVHAGPAAPLPRAYRERLFIPRDSFDDRPVFEIEERDDDSIDTMRQSVPREIVELCGPAAVWNVVREGFARVRRCP